MTFTDKDTGAEYEAVKGVDFMKQAEITTNPDNYLVIRPINKPKCEIRTPADVRIDGSEGIDVYWADKDQAQLMKECHEELMRVIMEGSGDLNLYPPRLLLDDITKAREALQKETEWRGYDHSL